MSTPAGRLKILRHKPCGRQVSLERRVNGYVLVCRQCACVVGELDVEPPGRVVLLTPAVQSDAT